jgi:hypothetical protein
MKLRASFPPTALVFAGADKVKCDSLCKALLRPVAPLWRRRWSLGWRSRISVAPLRELLLTCQMTRSRLTRIYPANDM